MDKRIKAIENAQSILKAGMSRRVKIKATPGTPIKISRGMGVRSKAEKIADDRLSIISEVHRRSTLTTVQLHRLSLKIRRSLNIGDKVIVLPTNFDTITKPKELYVRELDNYVYAG